MKGLRHLDYAVYGDKVIVPLILLDIMDVADILDDETAGRCRTVLRRRRK